MNVSHRLVNSSLKRLTRIICRVNDSQLQRVPVVGPLILVANHINFLDVPIMYTHLMPRPLTGFAKAETWKNPAMALLFNHWSAIPLRRGDADLEAIRRAIQVLRDGGILAVAPEGTRSGNGSLKRGHPGVVLMAEMSAAPILPMAYYGGERFSMNFKRLRRTEFNIVVGQPFRLKTDGARIGRSSRQQITDEIMYQVAALLPPAYRGYYRDLGSATYTHLSFEVPGMNNLTHALIEPA